MTDRKVIIKLLCAEMFPPRILLRLPEVKNYVTDKCRTVSEEVARVSHKENWSFRLKVWGSGSSTILCTPQMNNTQRRKKIKLT
jgi:hypothetical protein